MGQTPKSQLLRKCGGSLLYISLVFINGYYYYYCYYYYYYLDISEAPALSRFLLVLRGQRTGSKGSVAMKCKSNQHSLVWWPLVAMLLSFYAVLWSLQMPVCFGLWTLSLSLGHAPRTSIRPSLLSLVIISRACPQCLTIATLVSQQKFQKKPLNPSPQLSPRNQYAQSGAAPPAPAYTQKRTDRAGTTPCRA